MGTEKGSLRIGIVDSDSGFVRVLTARLEAAGHDYRVLSGGVPPEELVAMKLNALLIDPGVLRTDPWDFLERICNLLPDLGVLVTTSEATVTHRVRGLRIGADDWLAKPCHPEEVLARVEAVVRRHRRRQAGADTGPMVAGEIEIRPDRFEAFVAGRPVGLTRREFELLQTLADSQGRVIERGAVYQSVWGYAMPHGDRSVDVFVRKLRSKLERVSPSWTYIHTHFGVGYRFDPESAVGDADKPAPEPRHELSEADSHPLRTGP